MTNQNSAQIIFFYGPAGSGKGTQAGMFLEAHQDEYMLLEYGKELRDFNAKYLESEGELGNLARRMDGEMQSGNPVAPEDLEQFIKTRIKELLDSEQKFVIDGAWRTVGEAEWLAPFLAAEGAQTMMYHIHISEAEAVKRATGRWYIEGSTKPYRSESEAQAECKDDQKPFQRYDDTDVSKIKQRYESMYNAHWAKVLEIYQSVAHGKIVVVDGEQDVEQIKNRIERAL